MAGLFDKVEFVHGPAIANRLTLAPLTNMEAWEMLNCIG